MLNSPITKLDGVWDVTCKGIARPINYIEDTKVIENGFGYNLMQGKRWGYFQVQINRSGPGLILNYDDQRNPRILRKVRDYVEQSGPGWAGVFKLAGAKVFTFRLDK